MSRQRSPRPLYEFRSEDRCRPGRRLWWARVGRVVLLALAFLTLVPAARAGGPSMLVGTADDTVRQPTLVAAKAKMGQLRLAGFDAVRVAQTWAPGEVTPPADDLAVLQNVAGAARLY